MLRYLLLRLNSYLNNINLSTTVNNLTKITFATSQLTVEKITG